MKQTHTTHPHIPTIALVGRVNVGKSTLFNKLIEEQKALVSSIPGTTRTNNEGIIVWRGKEIRVIDTGGLSFEAGVPLEEDIIKQSERAMKQADVILFITDGQVGVLPQEKTLAKRMRRISVKPVLLVANKVDTTRIAKQLTEPEWYKLGLGEPFPISSVSGRNVGDLLDTIFELLETHATPPTDAVHEEEEGIDAPIQISIIGKPNVGKSSLFNKIIGEEKVIVNEMAHTTREPFDTLVEYTPEDGEEADEESTEATEETVTEKKSYSINFIDTAGIRRKAKVSGSLERQGITKSITSLEESDLILFVIDGSETISTQDMQLGGLIERRSKSVIIIVNKWDLAEDNSDTKRNEVKKMVYSYFPHLDFADILFVSGKTGYGVQKLFPKIIQIWKARHISIPRQVLKKFLQKVTKEHRPARGKGTRHPELFGLEQINSAPPVFELVVKYRTSLHRSYINYLENKLREEYGFQGTPIVIKLTKAKRLL
ncbi:MAG: ribosome-associated GTPase EngA [Candidatus Magasanikbacteria bacterium]|nr:ribosome-associated GTPase EngA [Candidatus Magasanikbacteria bacterium]